VRFSLSKAVVLCEVFFSFRIESNSYCWDETGLPVSQQLWGHAVQFHYVCGLANAHIGLRSVSCDRDHLLTACTNSGQAYPVDHASPKSQCGRLKAAILCEQCPSHSLSRLPTRQAKRCCYVINVFSFSLGRSRCTYLLCVYASPPSPRPLHRCGAGRDESGVWRWCDRRQRSNTCFAWAHACLTL